MSPRAGVALTAALTLWAAPTMTACSSESPAPAPLPSNSANPEAQNSLHSCAEATKSLTSAHVEIVLTGKFDRLGQVSAVDGDAQASPLVVNGTVKYQNGSAAPLVVANDTVSVKQGGVWNDVGATSTLVPPAVIDPRQGLPALLDSTESPQLGGSETIGSVDTNRVTATIPADKAKELLPEAKGPADLTVWIRKTPEPVLVRALIGLSANQSISVTLSNWNVPVMVSPAPAP